MNLKEQRAATLTAAQSVIDRAKAAGRDITSSEQTTVEAKFAEIAELDTKIKKAAKSADIISALNGLGGDGLAAGHKFWGAKSAMAGNILTAMGERTGATYGEKALITAGDVYADVPLLQTDPLELPRPPASILAALNVTVVSTPTFNYLRQGTRTNNAAPVAVGGTKPTSVYGIGPVAGALHVIAHISEAFDEYWVSDSPSLLQFLQWEMVYGLNTAAENQILNGSGTAPALRGLANTSGIQTQAFTTDKILTTRKAVTAVEVLGYAPRMFVLNPTDWEAIETSTLSAGAYVLNAEGQASSLPVDRAARRLWGVPVVLSTTQATGGAWLVSDGSVEVISDGKVRVKVSDAQGGDFATNQLRMRVESRFELAVTAPMGVVSIALAV